MRHKKRIKHELDREKKNRKNSSLSSNSVNTSIPSSTQPISPSSTKPQTTATRGGGSIPDNGQGLIDLIERTIEPDFWETNGGPGSIYYYRPLRVLVISATAEIHHRVGGNVKAIRKAGQ